MKEKLKELREKRGLSQAEVAQEIGISRQMYNKYERGDTEPSLSAIKALCTLYAVSYEELLGSNSYSASTVENDSQKSASIYETADSAGDMVVSSPTVPYGATKTSLSKASPYGTENYFAQIMSLLPKLLLSEKSRLLTAVAQSMTEEVEVQTKSRKSQPMKVNQDDVYFPTEEEYRQHMTAFLDYAKSKHFNSNGEKWTREDMHER